MFNNIYYTQFENGLKIIILHRNIPTVTICLRGLAGSNYENESEVGCAHLLEHIHTSTLFYKNRINKITNYGGRVVGTTSRDDVAYLVKSLKEYYQISLNFLLEIFLEKKFDESFVDQIKNNVLQEIKQNKNDPKKHIMRLSYQNLFPKQRFSKFNTGDEGDIKNLAINSIYSFKNNHYYPNNFVLTVCGDINPQLFIKIIKKFFTKNNYQTKNRFKKLKYKKNKQLKVLTQKYNNLNQLHLKIDFYGTDTSNKNKYSYLLFSKILKIKLQENIQNFNSKYYIPTYNLDVNSFSSNTYGLFGIYICMDDKYLISFIDIVKKTLKSLTKKAITQGELNVIKNKIYCDLIFNLEKTSLASDFYSELYLYDQVAKSHVDELDNYLACDVSSIQKAALTLYKQMPKITVLSNSMSELDQKIYWK